MIQLAITDHAFERAKERVGWNRSALARMLERVFYDGIAATTSCKRVSEFLSSYEVPDPSRFARAYGEHVFLFTRTDAPDSAVLVTVLRLPHELREPIRAARRFAYAT